MKVLVTTHAQMFQTNDGKVWTNSLYGYDFFRRYFDVFSEVRIVSRMKKIEYSEVSNLNLVSGDNLEFYALPFYHGPWQYAKQFLNIQKELTKAIKTCDCAILRIPDQVAFSLSKVLEKNNIPFGIEVVAHSWDLYAEGTIDTKLRPFLRRLWDFNQKHICKKADGVSYVTENYIQKRYPSGIESNNKSRLETNYTSASLEETFFGQPREISQFDKSNFNLIHVAGINNTSKGHKELIQLMRDLKNQGYNHHLTFVGGGKLLDTFKELSASFGVENQITFTGRIDDVSVLSKILSDSDVFIFPSLTEGLPRVIIEAMAIGLPCIATDVGGMSELISPEFLVEPRNYHDLLDKTIQILNDKELLYLESERNFYKVEKDYKSNIVQGKRNKFYNFIKKLAYTK